jgi:hypothetical protein
LCCSIFSGIIAQRYATAEDFKKPIFYKYILFKKRKNVKGHPAQVYFPSCHFSWTIPPVVIPIPKTDAPLLSLLRDGDAVLA